MSGENAVQLFVTIVFFIGLFSIPFFIYRFFKSIFSKKGYKSEDSTVLKNAPFSLNMSALNSREITFYKTIYTLLSGTNYIISIKPHIGDFINVLRSASKQFPEYIEYFENVNLLQIDFLISDANFCPILAIDLDESTALLAKKVKRFEFVQFLFKSVSLPFIKIYNFSPHAIKTQLSEFLLINNVKV